MARLRFTEQFIDDTATVCSPRLHDHLMRVLRMLERFPESGSPDVPASIAQEFGPGIRKCALDPFDLVYEYEKDGDVVMLHGLVNQRMAR